MLAWWQACRVTVVGVDACKRGWAAVVLRAGRPPEAHFLARIADLAASVPDAQVVAIDIPIGLPAEGHRLADRAVRCHLQTRRNSLFMTPIRDALLAPAHREATSIAVERTGSGVSQQAYALRSKIFEVEAWLSLARCPVYEVHPELSFAVMRGGPATAPKKSWYGLVERQAALRAEGIVLDHIDPAVGAVVGSDDMIDAAAAAWSGARLLSGAARPFPDPPDTDVTGRQIAIWA